MVDTIKIFIKEGEKEPKIKTLGDYCNFFLKQLNEGEDHK